MAKKRSVKKSKTTKYVTVRKIKKPVASRAPAVREWNKVTIKLTDEQVAELKKLGVKTSEIAIVTYNLARLRVAMPN